MSPEDLQTVINSVLLLLLGVAASLWVAHQKGWHYVEGIGLSVVCPTLLADMIVLYALVAYVFLVQAFTEDASRYVVETRMGGRVLSTHGANRWDLIAEFGWFGLLMASLFLLGPSYLLYRGTRRGICLIRKSGRTVPSFALGTAVAVLLAGEVVILLLALR